MKIVAYTQEYEREVVELWNQVLVVDTISVDQFRKQVLLDDNFDETLCYVGLKESKVVGFLLAIKRKFPYLERGLEPKRGWISVMFVETKHQGLGFGTTLLQQAEADLKQRGVEEITIAAYSPNYFFAGVDKTSYAKAVSFFQTNGYVLGDESYSMCKPLQLYQLSESTLLQKQKAEASGFTFQVFDQSYALKLLEFAGKEFGGGWKRNASLLLQAGQGEDCILLVLNEEDDIVGFCMRCIDGNPMRFGPIGVKSSVRNFGIGGILLDLMQYEMVKKRIYHMFFLSTDVPGRRFYERHGLSVVRTFVGFQKRLEGESNE